MAASVPIFSVGTPDFGILPHVGALDPILDKQPAPDAGSPIELNDPAVQIPLIGAPAPEPGGGHGGTTSKNGGCTFRADGYFLAEYEDNVLENVFYESDTAVDCSATVHEIDNQAIVRYDATQFNESVVERCYACQGTPAGVSGNAGARAGNWDAVVAGYVQGITGMKFYRTSHCAVSPSATAVNCHLNTPEVNIPIAI
jgi:hypothetical protein